MRKDVPNFFYFFVSFRYIDLYPHQNPLLLLLHSAGHRDAGLIIETPFVTFVPIVIWEKMSPIFFTFSFRFVTLIYTPIRIHCCSCYIVLDTEMQALSLKLPLLHLFRSLYEKRCPQFFFTFSFRFVTLIYTPISIQCCSCYIVLDTEMQALSLKLPLLHLFRSLYEKRCPQFFFTFSFRFVTLIYTPISIQCCSCYIVLDKRCRPYHWNSLCYICSSHYKRKDVPNFLGIFSFRFVTLIDTPIRIHGYSCYIEMQALSLKLPLLHLFRSLYEKRCPNSFGLSLHSFKAFLL